MLHATDVSTLTNSNKLRPKVKTRLQYGEKVETGTNFFLLLFCNMLSYHARDSCFDFIDGGSKNRATLFDSL